MARASSHSWNVKLVRKWRQKSNSGLKTAATADQWVFEVGHNYEVRPMADSTLGMIENNTTVGRNTFSGRRRVNNRRLFSRSSLEMTTRIASKYAYVTCPIQWMFISCPSTKTNENSFCEPPTRSKSSKATSSSLSLFRQIFQTLLHC